MGAILVYPRVFVVRNKFHTPVTPPNFLKINLVSLTTLDERDFGCYDDPSWPNQMRLKTCPIQMHLPVIWPHPWR